MRGRLALVAVSLAGCGRIAFDASDAASSCPPGYTFDTGSCYRASTMPATWLAAEAVCEADGVGAHLAAVQAGGEVTVVLTYVASSSWIGATDLAMEGDFRTVLNTFNLYVNFATGNGMTPAEDCVALEPGGLTDDLDCALVKDYVCEYDGIPAVSVAWAVCPVGYTFTGRGCYKFVPSGGPTTWVETEAACEAEGAGTHLVVLDSVAEAMAVDSFVPNTIFDHFIGLTDLATEGTYLGVTNLPPGFVSWDAGEPDGGTAQNCVVFTDSTTMQTRDCGTGDDYVCEYDGIAPVPAAWGQ